MSSSDRIARNTVFLTAASVLQKVLSFGYYAFLAKALGTADTGRYNFALTFTSIFIIFMDFGIGPLLTREGAKEEKDIQKHITELWSVKVLLIGVFYVLCIIAAFVAEAFFANVDPIDRQLILLGSLIIVVDTLTFTLFSIFRALRTLQFEAMSIVIYQATIVSCGALVIFLGLPVTFFLLALLIGSLAQCVFMFWTLKRRTTYTLAIDFSQWRKLKGIIAIAAPFAVAGIIYRLTGSIDTLMLKVLKGESAVGWYSLAFKLTFALTVLPGAFATSYYPAMSAYLKQKSDRLGPVFENAMVYMLLLSAPIAVGVFIVGGAIIESVWGSLWRPSAAALSALMIGLPFVFLNYPVGNLLNAAGRQYMNTLNMGIALLMNVALNAWLIPLYSFRGAAIASSLSAIALVLLGLPWVYSIVAFSPLRIIEQMMRVSLATAMMGFVVYYIQYSMPLPIVILIAAIVYVVALLLTRVVRLRDLQKLYHNFRQRIA